jgi:hypothetical protein
MTRPVPEAAMVAGALARLKLIADVHDGLWKGAALTAFDVVADSHEEARLIIATVAKLPAIVEGPPPNRHRFCRWCMTVQVGRRNDRRGASAAGRGCIHPRARRWLGEDG